MDREKFSNLKLDVYSDEAIGDRDYMEDYILFATSGTDKNTDKIDNSNVTPYACFFVFDGHGGIQAALFAKKNLLNQLLQQEDFHSDEDEKVKKAIKEAFLNVQDMMQKDSCNWPKTEYGRKNTSGTTVSMVMIRKNKMYIAHVGDSRVVMGEENGSNWNHAVLAEDHKPDDTKEMERIKRDGGEVIWRAGCPRVAWRRKRLLKSVGGEDVYDMVPFLAVARSLGDLWSYNPDKQAYTVSPEPDVTIHNFDPKKMRCIILASDGLWNVIHSGAVVKLVQTFHNNGEEKCVNIAKHLVNATLASCAVRKVKADNTSVVVICPSIEESEQKLPQDFFSVNFFEKPKIETMFSSTPPPQETKLSDTFQNNIDSLTSKPILINTVQYKSINSELEVDCDDPQKEESLEDANLSICDVSCINDDEDDPPSDDAKPNDEEVEEVLILSTKDEKSEEQNHNNLVKGGEVEENESTKDDSDISSKEISCKDESDATNKNLVEDDSEENCEECSEFGDTNDSNSELNPSESSSLISSPFSKMNLTRIGTPSLVRSLKRKSNSYHGTDSKKSKFVAQVSTSYSTGCKTRPPFESLQVCS